MKIAITGGSGGIGRAVTSLALAHGHSVVSIDRVQPSTVSPDRALSFCQLELSDYAALVVALQGCDAIVHLGAIPRPGNHPDHTVHNNNVVGSYNALQKCSMPARWTAPHKTSGTWSGPWRRRTTHAPALTTTR